MRRTSVGKLICPTGEPKPWAEIKCDSCPTVGITIMAMRCTPEHGASELAFCGTKCATLSGWPWLRSERDAGVAVITEQRSLFEASNA